MSFQQANKSPESIIKPLIPPVCMYLLNDGLHDVLSFKNGLKLTFVLRYGYKCGCQVESIHMLLLDHQLVKSNFLVVYSQSWNMITNEY